MSKKQQKITLFKIFNTPVVLDPIALITPIAVFGLGSWVAGRLTTNRPGFLRLRFGLIAMIVYQISELIHYLGHIISSWWVEAPMDKVYLTFPLPSSIYYDNLVTPDQHIGRSMGGPIINILTVIKVLFLRPFTRSGSFLRELVDLSVWMNLLFGIVALFPLPFIDGGTILKWRLVKQGQSEAEADLAVRKTNLFFVGVLMGVGMFFALWERLKRLRG
ncbi:hypothetical protein QUF64_07785 [Anaerolineales bacterium HSG6]|nr:hypothetical protein [Anaerolineales bacterium HSG6]MDM8531466.1 hypothetical protein [Anaerolineales bacterium HSG25]